MEVDVRSGTDTGAAVSGPKGIVTKLPAACHVEGTTACDAMRRAPCTAARSRLCSDGRLAMELGSDTARASSCALVLVLLISLLVRSCRRWFKLLTEEERAIERGAYNMNVAHMQQKRRGRAGRFPPLDFVIINGGYKWECGD